MKKGKILVVGSLNLDLVVDVDHIPAPGETILGRNLTQVPGGKGANQACATGRLGGNVTMIGAVGNDSAMELEHNSLKKAGVDLSGIIQKEGNTGSAFITVGSDGSNSIVVMPGANAKLSPEDIESKKELILQSDIVVMQLEIPIETVLYTAKLAKNIGKKVILDPAPVPEPFPEELFSYVDIIKPNSTEAAMLTDMEDNSKNWMAIAEKLHSMGIKDVCITLGEEGVLIHSEKYGIEKIPAYKVKAIDTTAAGDTFTAALAIKLAEGEDIIPAANFASAAAAIAVTRKGAQSSIPSRKEVEDYILANGKSSALL